MGEQFEDQITVGWYMEGVYTAAFTPDVMPEWLAQRLAEVYPNDIFVHLDEHRSDQPALVWEGDQA